MISVMEHNNKINTHTVTTPKKPAIRKETWQLSVCSSSCLRLKWFQSCVKDLEDFGLRSAFYNKIECGGSCLHSHTGEADTLKASLGYIMKHGLK